MPGVAVPVRDQDVYAIASKLAYDRGELHPDPAAVTLVRQLAEEAGGVEPLARQAGAWGVCDWCGVGEGPLAIVSTAGARCPDCVDLPLCGWCGEAPDETGEGRCERCAADS